MARLEYADIDSAPPEIQQLAEQIARERGGRLINLYRMLLLSPPVAAGCLRLGGGIRFASALDSATQELAICYVARLTGSEYEWRGHARLAHQAGITEDQLASLPGWRDNATFDSRQQVVLGLTEQLTRDVEVDDVTFASVRQHFEPRQVLELVATIGYYNMIARVLVGLRVDPEGASS